MLVFTYGFKYLKNQKKPVVKLINVSFKLIIVHHNETYAGYMFSFLFLC